MVKYSTTRQSSNNCFGDIALQYISDIIPQYRECIAAQFFNTMLQDRVVTSVSLIDEVFFRNCLISVFTEGDKRVRASCSAWIGDTFFN